MYICDINDHVYMCMCHQVSLISFLTSQFPLITSISPKQNPDLLHLFIWGTSIRGLQYPRRSRWALIFMLWEVSEKKKKHVHVVNHGINLQRMRNVVDSWRPSTSHAESWKFFGSTSYSFNGDVKHHDHLLRRVIQRFF